MPVNFRSKIANCAASVQYGQPIVVAETRSGERMQLQAVFKDIAHAERIAARVMERGSVDRSLWAPLTPVAGSAADLAMRTEAASRQLAYERARAEHRIAA
jgi:conjugal transfer/entry exclusion protein